MLKKDDGLLDFTQPADSLERRVRAMNPWPGAFFDWNGTLIKVHRAHSSGEKSPGTGVRYTLQGWPAVGTSEGSLILDEIQPAGKKTMPGRAFLAGARNWDITNNDE
jgi:methionyl-tRNA formyltransferase